MKRERRANFTVVNHSVPRADGVAKVTGSAIYTSDMALDAHGLGQSAAQPVRARANCFDRCVRGAEAAGRDRRADRRRSWRTSILITATR